MPQVAAAAAADKGASEGDWGSWPHCRTGGDMMFMLYLASCSIVLFV
jgi:hypothetical protein